jgi:DNA-binding NarL/FixJ family response regulator
VTPGHAACVTVGPMRVPAEGEDGDYLTKDAGAEQIRQGLAQVFNDGAAIDPAVQRHLLDAIGAVPAARAQAVTYAYQHGLAQQDSAG